MMLKEIDKSKYLNGLLVLIKQRGTIEEPVKRSVKHIIKILDFNQDFIDESMNNLLNNNYIIEEPPKFSDYRFAESFLKDCIHVAFSDGTLNFKQVEWIINTAKKNNLSEQWVFIEIENLFSMHLRNN